MSGSNRGYAAEADALAVQYESISFEDVHGPGLPWLPPTPCDALDVGAGTGRDAAGLAARGFRVAAVEPTAGLREHGRRIHASHPIEWIDDGLPDLAALGGRRFGLVLLTAVWMHLDALERDTAMARLGGLLASGGRVFMTLRHGPVPERRRMFDVSPSETVALAARHGMACRHDLRRPDMLGRPDVRWSYLVLERA